MHGSGPSARWAAGCPRLNGSDCSVSRRSLLRRHHFIRSQTAELHLNPLPNPICRTRSPRRTVDGPMSSGSANRLSSPAGGCHDDQGTGESEGCGSARGIAQEGSAAPRCGGWWSAARGGGNAPSANLSSYQMEEEDVLPHWRSVCRLGAVSRGDSFSACSMPAAHRQTGRQIKQGDTRGEKRLQAGAAQRTHKHTQCTQATTPTHHR